MHNHSDSLMVKFDLHLPEGGQDDSRLLSRFFESLKARIKARESRNQRNKICVHKSQLANVWCR
ncbi:YagK/YfjJ domain-containing protein [Vibrio gangliei]